MIVGTAGHVDHGKSALVTALTGRPMDRLAEERRRGITIDLGFAPLALGDVEAGVVDVPGHEDFVRTMVAGASGIDLALLVVAADEGLMPQTLEHLAVLEHLGVPRGIPVITKRDLVDDDWLALVTLEVAERTAASPVAFEPPIAVSARTGEGLDALRAHLAAAAAALPRRAGGDDLFRLPVDRAFSLAGTGTVVAGTVWSGGVAPGDQVRLLPGGREARVRSVQRHGATVERGVAGERTAVALAGIATAEVRRGMWLVAEDAPWRETTALDAVLELDAAAPRALGLRTRVRVLLGTAEVLARVQPRSAIAPGGRGLARLVLETPAVARGGDRFVLRAYSPVTTIGGGRVLDPDPPRRAAWPAGLDAADAVARVAALVGRRRWGIAADRLPLLLGAAPADAAGAARAADGVLRVGPAWILDGTVDAVRERARRALAGLHEQRPAEPGVPLETLRRAVPAPDWLTAAVLDDLRREGAIELDGGLVRAAGFRPRVAGGADALERLVACLEAAGLTPPDLVELARETGIADPLPALRLAERAGRVAALARDRYAARTALEGFADAVRALAADGTPVTPAALRERLGLSRKYLIPLLEWADREGVTERRGDGRVLRSARGPGHARGGAA